MIEIVKWSELNGQQQKKILLRPLAQENVELQKNVSLIIETVRGHGDHALIDFTKKFDAEEINSLEIDKKEFEQANLIQDREVKSAIDTAISRIEFYHKQQMPKSIHVDQNDGIICQRIYRPIQKIGLYVPGGVTPLISTIIMLAIPARLVGCPLKILCTPPKKDGSIHPLILVTAQLCGIEKIYKCGGAQAIAAMAYGTETITKVDKIFGPGNNWVNTAKMLVSRDPLGASIDLPAGPSELLIIADKYANVEFVAADLLSQAEHGSDSQVILITESVEIAQKIQQQILTQSDSLPRSQIIKQSLKNGKIIVTNHLNEAINISNMYAPEHLSLQIENPEEVVEKINCAGAIFLGHWSAETMGDYINGSNHVLPTHGYARSCSGLSVNDFMTAISVQSVSSLGIKKYGEDAMKLAEIEGLNAHRNAVGYRVQALENINEYA